MTHPSPDTVLEVVNLTKHFGSLTAVSNVSLRIGEGVHSIIGPNGAGKTTFFNLLSGFLTPDEGKIFYRGSDITGLAPYEVSQLGIGRSFQITSIFPALSVYENIRVAAQSRVSARYNFLVSSNRLPGIAASAKRILQGVGLEKWADAPAKNLPYGLQRCLDIGISLATDPRILLLDEPTSGMSGEDTENILRLVKKISTEIPVVLIEHNVDVVLAISDRIAVLYQGLLLAAGSPAEIQANEDVQEAYLGGY
ncbi:MAG: ABC transporter ATP-binding protein [Thermodesulfobacteriota bacterium]